MPKTPRTTIAEFVSKAREVHGDRFDYSESKYLTAKIKVAIRCRIHGIFLQLPWAHLRGQKCPECAQTESRTTTAGFVASAIRAHGPRYDYSKAAYLKSGDKVCLGCPEHGDFWQIAADHLRGSGCPSCAALNRLTENHTRRDEAARAFKDKAVAIHGERYDYSAVRYVTALDKVEIGCEVHGKFLMEPSRHLSGQGCPKCGHAKRGGEQRRMTGQTFIEKARKVHGNTYGYGKSIYIGSKTDLTITCQKHGDFRQFPNNHLNGAGCPNCAIGASKGEEELWELLSSLDDSAVRWDRQVIKPLELDMVLPGSRLAVEYCGLYWHRSSNYVGANTGALKPSQYHLDKLAACEREGYRLITIFEDEWKSARGLVASLLSRTVSRNDLVVIGGRKCIVTVPTALEAREFYQTNHLSGQASAGTHLGLAYAGELVCTATFSRTRAIFGGEKPKGEYELVRFAQRQGLIIPGALAKLVSAFAAAQPEAEQLISYVDRRWFTGKTYLDAGFSLVHATAPNYWYVKGATRFHRYTFAKHKLAELLEDFDPTLTEKENMAANGYYTIHDCGSFKFRKALR